MDDTGLTPAQRAFVMRQIIRWLEIKERYEERPWPDASQLRMDVWHSALLQRLLSGEEPLPKPPPIRHSYPDYEAEQPWNPKGLPVIEVDWNNAKPDGISGQVTGDDIEVGTRVYLFDEDASAPDAEGVVKEIRPGKIAGRWATVEVDWNVGYIWTRGQEQRYGPHE